jgi:GTP diphosphokinase / guanosine-3',5'-bis(diphosphate) 3'-diphosphatase
MIVLAANRHAGQFDKGGHPYILHVMAVMYLVDSEDDEVKQIAAGHDLVEDTGVTYKELQELGFSDRVVHGIRCLTKVPGETYDEYKAKVKSNPDAVAVKMADLKHNSDISRLKGLRQKDFDRMAKYMAFYAELSAMKKTT